MMTEAEKRYWRAFFDRRDDSPRDFETPDLRLHVAGPDHGPLLNTVIHPEESNR